VIRKVGAGSVLWLNDPQRFNELQKIAVEESPSRSPLLFALDVIHGYRTIFPIPLAMAASWDPAVAEQSQAVAAREARAAGLHWTFGPTLVLPATPAGAASSKARVKTPSSVPRWLPPRCAVSRVTILPTRNGCWPAPSTLPVTAIRTVGAITTRFISPKRNCAMWFSRPSRPPSRPGWQLL
jgi:hypothetical protein